MYFTTALLSLLAVPALALPSLTVRQGESSYPYPPVQITSKGLDHFCFDTSYVFTWEGGSGFYQVGTILKYPGLISSNPNILEPNTTSTSAIINTYKPEQVPANSTYLVSISDAGEGASTSPDDQWWASTGDLPLIQCDESE